MSRPKNKYFIIRYVSSDNVINSFQQQPIAIQCFLLRVKLTKKIKI